MSIHSLSQSATLRATFLSVLIAAAVAGCGSDSDSSSPAPVAAPDIKILSSQPQYVSGGDALVEVKAPASVQPAQLAVALNGRDVLSQLVADPENGTLRGVVNGMVDGANVLTATAPNPGGAPAQTSLTVTNYPITGPILAGPLLTPYECRTVESGLGQPTDVNCSAPRRIDYFYRAADDTFKPLSEPTGPAPLDLVTTTTNDGRTVPYVVRVDSGTIGRTIYRIAVLDEPTDATLDPESWKPGAGWNHKLVVSFGGGAGTQYNQGVSQATGALNDTVLSRGFAHAISTELVNQQRGNAVLQGETLMMIKEYFIEHYGVPKWTVGSGGSGGAIQQLVITQIYPGLLDGLQPSAAFPDSSLHVADCRLLEGVYAAAPAIWTDAKKMAVNGFTKGTCRAWDRSFVNTIVATNAPGCALNDTSKLYDPVNNRTGARCTTSDMRANISGRDPATGFARRPLDNVGLQYGLEALNTGAISVTEFLDLNEQVGGYDIDGNVIAQRSVGDPIAITAAYESGLLNSGGGGLATVPILNFRSYTDAIGDIHSRERDLVIRARLEKANGRSDNQVIWVAPRTGVNLAPLALDAMSQWLDNMAADPAPLSADKVVHHKPAEATDACWDGSGAKIAEPASFDGTGQCNTLYPVHGEPRLQAGAPLANDILKCQLKPVDYADYQADFSVADRERVAAIFASGVCDFSKPGVGQVPLRGTYQRYPVDQAGGL